MLHNNICFYYLRWWEIDCYNIAIHCLWGTESCGDKSYHSWRGNVFFFKEKDSGEIYSRQKPAQLYEVQINLFTRDKTLHINDACVVFSHMIWVSDILVIDI